MNAFLIDLWNDLREKRLWPVAALLLARAHRGPVVLSKPSEEPASTVVAAEPAEASPARDQGPRGAHASPRTTPGTARPSTSSTRATRSSRRRTSSPTPNDTTDRADPRGSTGRHQRHGRTGTASTPTGRAAAAPDRPAAPPSSKKTTTAYRYVIDATFIANGEKRKIDGMDPLDVLPSHSNALLVFLGVRSEGGNAVFIRRHDPVRLRHRRRQVQAEAGRMRLPVPAAGREGDLHDRDRRHLRPQGSRHPQGQAGLPSRSQPRRRRRRTATMPPARPQSRAARPSTRSSRSSSRTS